MHTLLLQLAGPMQSWGVQSRFGVRDTGLEPSKSGVIGLLCAAWGIPRSNEHTTQLLAAFKMGVRVDKEGYLGMDFHTAQNVYKAGGGTKKTEISHRYYLADAVFLVGLESAELDFLAQLHSALRNPVWPLYLGRKSFVPSPPVYLPDGMRVGELLLEALARYPYLGPGEPPGRVRLVLDDPHGTQVRQDLPISFAKRLFAPRRITTEFPDWQLALRR